MLDSHDLQSMISVAHMIVGEAHGQQFQNGKRRKFRVYYVWITRVWDEGLNMSVENRPENDVGLLMTDSGWQTKPEFRKVVLDHKLHAGHACRSELFECGLGDFLTFSLEESCPDGLESGRDDALPHRRHGLGDRGVLVGGAGLSRVR